MEWEGEALKARDKGARVVITRFGIVMGEKGGALSQMIPLFKKYIGGPIGSGKQWFSWIHIKDLAEAFAFLLKHPEISGPVNVCSPNPVRNKDLAKALGKALHKPSFMPAPGFMVKLGSGRIRFGHPRRTESHSQKAIGEWFCLPIRRISIRLCKA